MACRALNAFLFCLVVLRWWCDCATADAMLALPPALNRKGIDATVPVEYGVNAGGAEEQVRDSHDIFGGPLYR